MSESAVLVARGLKRDYGDLIALSGVDLTVRSGEMVALVGPNGAGKSTLLGLAAGLLTPSDGAVHVAGAVAGSLEARAATSFVPDLPSLYDDLSLDEHLECLADSDAVVDREHADRVRLYVRQRGSRGINRPASPCRPEC